MNRAPNPHRPPAAPVRWPARNRDWTTAPRGPRDQINEQIAAVLDPLAERCRGWPVETLTPMVRNTWRREFHSEISKKAAAETAAAIHDGRPWTEALWTDGW